MIEPTWQSDCGQVQLYLGDCREILPHLGKVDCVIADPPYSERTHAGHDASAKCHTGLGNDGASRGPLGYSPWGGQDCVDVASLLPPHGWACVFSDHVLAREWEYSLDLVGRYVFAPLPCVVRGRSVRLSGDGPSSWTDWLVVSRTAKEARWGTLPGYYEGNPSQIRHKGGKPQGMMTAIVKDYSREGDTVLDFTMGSGTTGIACLRTGRKFIGIEISPKYFEIAKERIQRELAQLKLNL